MDLSSLKFVSVHPPPQAPRPRGPEDEPVGEEDADDANRGGAATPSERPRERDREERRRSERGLRGDDNAIDPRVFREED